MSAKLFVRDFLSFFKAFNLPTGVTGVTPYPKYRQIEKYVQGLNRGKALLGDMMINNQPLDSKSFSSNVPNPLFHCLNAPCWMKIGCTFLIPPGHLLTTSTTRSRRPHRVLSSSPHPPGPGGSFAPTLARSKQHRRRRGSSPMLSWSKSLQPGEARAPAPMSFSWSSAAAQRTLPNPRTTMTRPRSVTPRKINT